MLVRTAEPERTAPVAGAALAIAAVGIATLLGAYYFQYVLHYQPCPLCLEQRIPYYVGIPLALVVALAARLRAPRPLLIAGFAALALALLGGAAGMLGRPELRPHRLSPRSAQHRHRRALRRGAVAPLRRIACRLQRGDFGRARVHRPVGAKSDVARTRRLSAPGIDPVPARVRIAIGARGHRD